MSMRPRPLQGLKKSLSKYSKCQVLQALLLSQRPDTCTLGEKQQVPYARSHQVLWEHHLRATAIKEAHLAAGHKISPLRVNLEPFLESSRISSTRSEPSLLGNSKILSSFVFGGCIGDSYLDTRTNALLGISQAGGAAESYCHLLTS